MFWIALAAQMSMPVALGLTIPDVRAVFSADDVPGYVQAEGVTRFVFTRTTVRADGTPQDCAAEPGSGDPKLDAYTCAIILKRGRFEPAKWLDGSPAYAILRVPVIWVIGDAPAESQVERAYPPDISLTVNRLPGDARKPVKLALMLAVDESGRVVGCEQWQPAAKHFHAKIFPELLPLACQQMTGAFTAQPAKDASGNSVRSVQSASVEFSRGS